jgi:hypothetical protein
MQPSTRAVGSKSLNRKFIQMMFSVPWQKHAGKLHKTFARFSNATQEQESELRGGVKSI